MSVKSISKAIFIFWFSAVCFSILEQACVTYYERLDEYTEDYNTFMDCGRWDHYERHARSCSAVFAKGVENFYSRWWNTVFLRVKWCAVDQCKSFVTFTNFVICAVGSMFVKATPTIAKKTWLKLHNKKI